MADPINTIDITQLSSREPTGGDQRLTISQGGEFILTPDPTQEVVDVDSQVLPYNTFIAEPLRVSGRKIILSPDTFNKSVMYFNGVPALLGSVGLDITFKAEGDLYGGTYALTLQDAFSGDDILELRFFASLGFVAVYDANGDTIGAPVYISNDQPFSYSFQKTTGGNVSATIVVDASVNTRETTTGAFGDVTEFTLFDKTLDVNTNMTVEYATFSRQRTVATGQGIALGDVMVMNPPTPYSNEMTNPSTANQSRTFTPAQIAEIAALGGGGDVDSQVLPYNLIVAQPERFDGNVIKLDDTNNGSYNFEIEDYKANANTKIEYVFNETEVNAFTGVYRIYFENWYGGGEGLFVIEYNADTQQISVLDYDTSDVIGAPVSVLKGEPVSIRFNSASNAPGKFDLFVKPKNSNVTTFRSVVTVSGVTTLYVYDESTINTRMNITVNGFKRQMTSGDSYYPAFGDHAILNPISPTETEILNPVGITEPRTMSPAQIAQIASLSGGEWGDQFPLNTDCPTFYNALAQYEAVPGRVTLDAEGVLKLDSNGNQASRLFRSNLVLPRKFYVELKITRRSLTSSVQFLISPARLGENDINFGKGVIISLQAATNAWATGKINSGSTPFNRNVSTDTITQVNQTAGQTIGISIDVSKGPNEVEITIHNLSNGQKQTVSQSVDFDTFTNNYVDFTVGASGSPSTSSPDEYILNSGQKPFVGKIPDGFVPPGRVNLKTNYSPVTLWTGGLSTVSFETLGVVINGKFKITEASGNQVVMDISNNDQRVVNTYYSTAAANLIYTFTIRMFRSNGNFSTFQSITNTSNGTSTYPTYNMTEITYTPL